MKQRTITAIVIIAALIPIFYFKIATDNPYNNYPIYILGIILTVVATSEMISMKETENKLGFEMRLLMYLAILYISFNGIFSSELNYTFDFNLFPILMILLTLAIVLKRNFKITDAAFMYFVIYYIGLSFLSIIHFFTEDVMVLLYIIFIAMASDTFAYFIGSLFGKHKLAPIISPKKTIEGSVGGALVATVLVSIYAFYVSMEGEHILYIVGVTLFLTIMSQFGDLFASALKRQYKIKDYGNLFPGHGGVLDRLDSILFTSLVYFYLLDLIKLFV